MGYIGYGEAIGLACAFFWALNGLIMRHYVAAFPPSLLNALRCGAAGLLAWLLMLFQPPLATFLQVTSFEWVLLVKSYRAKAFETKDTRGPVMTCSL